MGFDESLLAQPRNLDVNDTINRTLLETIREGEVEDTPENRTNAALVCITSLYRQLQKLKGEVSTLKEKLGLTPDYNYTADSAQLAEMHAPASLGASAFNN